MGNQRKSAMGAMVQQAVLPPLQQMVQQSTQAVMQAIASIPQPQQQAIDPRQLQQIQDSVDGISLPNIMVFVQTLDNLAEQINTLSAMEQRPIEWRFDVVRDKQTQLITSVEVTPL